MPDYGHTNDLKIRAGEPSDLDMIYDGYCADFPPEERKGRAQLGKLMTDGRYRLLLAYAKKNTAPVGYAFVYEVDGCDALWLDYIAIYSGSRGAGLGSQLLATIAQKYGSGLGMFLEVEIPDSPDPQVRDLQRRRIGLYERLGAQRLTISYRLPKVGGDYPMLLYFLPGSPLPVLTREQVCRVVTAVIRNIHSDIPGREEVLAAVLETAQDTALR